MKYDPKDMVDEEFAEKYPTDTTHSLTNHQNELLYPKSPPRILSLLYEVDGLYRENCHMKEELRRLREVEERYEQLQKDHRSHSEAMLNNVFKLTLCTDRDKMQEVFAEDVKESDKDGV